MRTFLFILIVTSGLEILGYPLVDVLLLGCFLFLVITINRTLKIRVNWLLIFCIYMILQVLRGMYVLGDFRMIYWVLFFVVVYFSYLYFIDLYRQSRIDHQFVKQIFNYSLVYFIIYGLLGFLIADPDDFQGMFWVGSSGAFIVLIPFVCAHFRIFQHSRYSLSKLKLPSILLVLATTVAHSSRIGLYLLFLYLICLMFQATFNNSSPQFLTTKAMTFNLKKLVLMFCVIAITLFAWDFGRNTVLENPGETGAGEIALAENILATDVDALETLSSDVGRVLMVISIYNKFVSSPVEMLVGSGWYTSRYTLKPFERKVRDQYSLSSGHAQGDTPLQVISLAAIVSDTGMVGLLFILYFFYKSSRQILETRNPGRMIFLIFLISNWLFFLVGFSLFSILSFLLFLPNGILVSLARVHTPANQLVKQVTKID